MDEARWRAGLALVAVLGFWTYAAFLGAPDLAPPDEPRYALVAREMVDSGDWLVPRLAGKPYSEKPPFLFWCIGGLGVLRGQVDEVAARLPAVLAAVGTLLLTAASGRRLFPDSGRGARAGLLAALMLATCSRFLVTGCRAGFDAPMTFWTTAAFWAFLRGFPLHGPADARSTRWQAAGFACAGVAVITKGVGAVLFLLGLAAVLVALREREGGRRVAWGPGLLVLAAVLAAWILPVALWAPTEYLEGLLFRQTVTRVFDPWTHVRPWHYYLGRLPLNFLPWTPVLGIAAWLGVRTLLRPADPDRRGLAFLWAVLASTFVFFSALPAKRDIYLMPALPWLSLWAGWGATKASEGEGRAGLRATLWLVLGAAALAGGASWAWPHPSGPSLPGLGGVDVTPEVLAVLTWPARAIGALLLAGAFAGAVALRRGRIGAACCVFALALVPAWNVYRGWVRPPLSSLDSGRDLAARIERWSDDGDAVLAYGPYDEGVPYYLGRPVEPASDPARVAERLRASPRVLVVTTRTGEAELRAALPATVLIEVDAAVMDGDPYVVLANR